jgi:hypothetical protein
VPPALRLIATCVASLGVGAASVWAAGGVLRFVALARHHEIAPGTGFAIAWSGVFIGGFLALWLLVATLLEHRASSPRWPIARAHLAGAVAWAVLVLLAAGFFA